MFEFSNRSLGNRLTSSEENIASKLNNEKKLCWYLARGNKCPVFVKAFPLVPEFSRRLSLLKCSISVCKSVIITFERNLTFITSDEVQKFNSCLLEPENNEILFFQVFYLRFQTFEFTLFCDFIIHSKRSKFMIFILWKFNSCFP